MKGSCRQHNLLVTVSLLLLLLLLLKVKVKAILVPLVVTYQDGDKLGTLGVELIHVLGQAGVTRRVVCEVEIFTKVVDITVHDILHTHTHAGVMAHGNKMVSLATRW